MKKQVLFIHGGGDNGYETDQKLQLSLQKNLGEECEVLYPVMRAIEEEKLAAEWLAQIDSEISKIHGEIILVGHSLGGSMILKYLSEWGIPVNITGIFLIAPPFWSGDRDWVQPLKLKKNFASQLSQDIPIFFYQCKDDNVVPYEHFARYKKEVPWASFREILMGGHQFNNDVSIVAMDIVANSGKNR
ncbi:alpha/beta fold hydrolase [Chryseobacterium gallinarum]|uniref:Alpha/beta fold hydrolase n=1 Tax=Chryseobacterium gallinarum TaxID=1324352 RepID=A0ABX6KN82_CHRGL|nr:alpha/beta fold hydrolase [Chryseobacterium gallinarum]QIY90107.1 alpha/beta fold hydrolase [Chryseobacterium gallinarum]